MHGLIAVDDNGRALTNMITWADLRSSKYAEEFKKTSEAPLIYERTGTPIHAMSPFCKLIWLRNELPEIFNAAYKFISIKEFIFTGSLMNILLIILWPQQPVYLIFMISAGTVML